MSRPSLRRLAIVLATIVIALVGATPRAHALVQGGYTTEKHPELGLTFQRARDYEQIPTQPDEQFVVMRFGEKIPENPKARKTVRPVMLIVWIDFVPDPNEPPPATGLPGSEGPGDGTGGARANAAPESSKPPINSLERWLERELPDWRLGKPVKGEERDGYFALEYTLIPHSKAAASAAGWAYALKNARRTVAVIGVAGEDEIRDQVRIWRTTAEHLKITEPEEQSSEVLDRYYARHTFADPQFRIGVRKKLVRGWKAEDTDHFIVIYDTPDQPLMRKIVRDVELLRIEYTKLFPPAGEINAVSTVRICKSRDEYFMYGGPPRTAGYWNRATEELVLYDAEEIDRNHQRIETNTFVALYHEAFHQFIHYSVGELPPHPWFDEGHGDYFSGAVVRDGKVQRIGVNPWRIKVAKYLVQTRMHVHWRDIIQYEQKQYYANAALCYAEGWSMIYFLRTSKEVAKKEAWAKILPTYFETLKKEWADELAKLDALGKKDDKAARAEAGLAARRMALDRAFARVDLDEIEQAWIAFVEKLEDPEHK